MSYTGKHRRCPTREKYGLVETGRECTLRAGHAGKCRFPEGFPDER
jgi:hypothetical protein